MARRCGSLTARFSQHDGIVAEKRVCEELSGAPDPPVDLHTGETGRRGLQECSLAAVRDARHAPGALLRAVRGRPLRSDEIDRGGPPRPRRVRGRRLSQRINQISRRFSAHG